MKCNECEKEIDIKAGEEISPEIGRLAPDCIPDLCRECFSKGWSHDPKEVFDAIIKDPVLSKIVDIQSPYL